MRSPAPAGPTGWSITGAVAGLAVIAHLAGCREEKLPPLPEEAPETPAEEEPRDPEKTACKVLTQGRAPRVRLRFSWQRSDKLSYMLQLDLSHTRQGRKTSSSMRAWVLHEVLGVDDDGGVIRVAFPKLVSYSPRVGRAEMASILSRWQMEVRLDESGRAEQAEPAGPSGLTPRASLPGPIGGGCVFPDQPVGPSARWRVNGSVEVEIPGPDGPTESLVETSTTYELVSLEQDRGRLLATIRGRSSVSVGGDQSAIGAGKGTSRFVFEVDTGRMAVLSSTTELKMETPELEQPLIQSQKLHMKLERPPKDMIERN
jgi:hypothetical protein